jgi:hypothetical protein
MRTNVNEKDNTESAGRHLYMGPYCSKNSIKLSRITLTPLNSNSVLCSFRNWLNSVTAKFKGSMVSPYYNTQKLSQEAKQDNAMQSTKSNEFS